MGEQRTFAGIAWSQSFGKPTQGVELTGKDGEPLLLLALVQAVVADAVRAGTG